MRKILLALLVMAGAVSLKAQNPNVPTIPTTTTPSGSCSGSQVRYLAPNGTLYTCQSGTWAASGSSGSGSGVSYCAPASGSTTAYTCAPSTALTSYTAGTVLAFIPDVTGAGGSTTVNVSGLGVKSIKQANGSSNPTSQGLPSGVMQYLTYDGTNFRSSLGVGQTSCTITASTSTTCTHNLGIATLDGPLYMTAYKSNGAIVGGTTATPLQLTDVVQVDANSATFTFNTAWTGTFWVSNGLTGPAGSTGATGATGPSGAPHTLNFTVTQTGQLQAGTFGNFACTINGWSVVGNSSGSLTMEIDAHANSAPPAAPTAPNTSTDKISASAPITVSAAQTASSGTSGVSTWTTSRAAYDSFAGNVTAFSGFTSAVVTVFCQ